MTVFNTNFLMLDAPSGEVEDLAAMRAAGFSGVFCNVHAYEPERWQLIRTRAKQQNMYAGPWARIDPTGHEFKVEMLNHLIDVALLWDNAPFIVNAEHELLADGGGAKWTELIARKCAGMDYGVSTEGWLYNPPAVDWTPLKKAPMLLQLFPVEATVIFRPGEDIMTICKQCQEHAWDCGIDCVYYTFG